MWELSRSRCPCFSFRSSQKWVPHPGRVLCVQGWEQQMSMSRCLCPSFLPFPEGIRCCRCLGLQVGRGFSLGASPLEETIPIGLNSLQAPSPFPKRKMPKYAIPARAFMRTHFIRLTRQTSIPLYGCFAAYDPGGSRKGSTAMRS